MKHIVSEEEFRAYTGFTEDDPQMLVDTYLRAAEDIVVEYLGYDPNYRTHDDYLSGTGDTRLYLKARPVMDITWIDFDGVHQDNCHVRLKDTYIYYDDKRKFPSGVENIHVVYSAGFREMPHVIKTAVLRISSLMLAESNGNIGITGKAYGDQSRTFINYNNYGKYLQPISDYRIINFGV